MVVVEKSSNSECICNSCVDKTKATHKISIGNGNDNIIIHLCKKCLYSLYQEAGMIGISVSDIL